jgi:hypothetical protein
MELHIKERLLIPTILPEKGNFMDFNLKKSIINKVVLTEQDRKDYEIVEKKEERRIEWNVQKDIETPLAVDFSQDELAYLQRACEAISEQQLPDEVWAMVEHIYDEIQK